MSWRKIDVKLSNEQAVLYENDPVYRVVFQPGNGTRYTLLFVKLGHELGDKSVDGGYLVVNLTAGFVRGGFINQAFMSCLHVKYVMEKMGAQIVDASEMTKLIGTVLMIPKIVVCTSKVDGELVLDSDGKVVFEEA